MRSICPNSEIELNLDHMPDDENHLRLYGNEQLLSISFNNLIDNACKFSENKKVVIKLFSDNQFVNVDIIDRGIGIHSQDLSKIFQPFYRGQNTQFIAGYGIGLALTKKS